LYDELENMRSTGITDEEFEQARSNIQWSTIMGLETSDDVAGFVWRQMLLRWEIVSLESILAKYMSVTKKEINTAAQSLQREKMYAYWIQ
jgi:predicted Zn-dependent peptidase